MDTPKGRTPGDGHGLLKAHSRSRPIAEAVIGHGAMSCMFDVWPAVQVRVARLIRNWVSRGTGRPVEPLSLPDFHAVPAMSR